jgi:hypothetical protein
MRAPRPAVEGDDVEFSVVAGVSAFIGLFRYGLFRTLIGMVFPR